MRYTYNVIVIYFTKSLFDTVAVSSMHKAFRLFTIGLLADRHVAHLGRLWSPKMIFWQHLTCVEGAGLMQPGRLFASNPKSARK